MSSFVSFSPQNLIVAPIAADLLGNKDEITDMQIVSGLGTFLGNTPYEIEFPMAPKSFSCNYAEIKGSKTIHKSIEVNLKGLEATINTSTLSQQSTLYCDVVYGVEVSSELGTIKLGAESSTFNVNIKNHPLVLKASAKTKSSLELSGVATAALSKTEILRASLIGNTGTISPGATCELDIEGIKVEIPVKSIALVGVLAEFDLSSTPIAEGKNFVIKCKRDAVELQSIIVNYEPIKLTTTNSFAFTYLKANSTTSASVITVIVVSLASIMSLLLL